MTSAMGFTGPWCASVKIDSDERLTLVDMKARMCEELTQQDGLFLSATVPWAFAVGQAFPNAKINHALHNGTLAKVYEHIRQHEERVLQTGGGFYKGKWLAVENFDPELKLDPLEFFYSRRHLQSRVVAGLNKKHK